MSILQEYEQIRKEIGEKAFQELEVYLAFHPDKFLSDLYYNEGNWEACQEWLRETPEFIKKHEPLYLVVENYKGICEHNFFGTKDEVQALLGASDREMESGEFYARSNISYIFTVCDSEEMFSDFLHGGMNDYSRMEKDADWYFDLDTERIQEHCPSMLPDCARNTGRSILRYYARGTEDEEYFKGYLESLYPKQAKELVRLFSDYAVHDADTSVSYSSSKEALANHDTEKGIMQVKRLRFSATQGEVNVSVNGKTIVQYGDEMWLQKKDGGFINGYREVNSSHRFHGPVIGGWGSLEADLVFAKAAILSYPDKICEALREKKVELDERISGAKETNGMKKPEIGRREDLRKLKTSR